MADAHHDLANTLEQAGHYARAETSSRRAIQVREGLDVEDPIAMASALTVLANAQLGQGTLDEAEAGYRRAQALREAALPPEHPHLSYSLHGLARVALARGEPDEAKSLAERAWTIRQGASTPRARRAATAFVLAQAIAAAEPRASSRSRARDACGRALKGYQHSPTGLVWRSSSLLSLGRSAADARPNSSLEAVLPSPDRISITTSQVSGSS